MKKLTKNILCGLLFLPFFSLAQYTDVINSNRPGASVSAFSVGKNVAQGEFGLALEKQKHDRLLNKTNVFAVDFAFRYGLFFEELEIVWDGTYLFDKLTDNSAIPPETKKRSGFLKNTIGVKYLFFDPFKDPERNKPNLYSWRANNTFKWRDLIPAVSAYVGINLNVFDSPYAYNNLFVTTASNFLVSQEEPLVSPRVMLATQSHLAGRWVLVTNIIYDKFTSDFPELSYIITVTHALNNPKWTVFAENQGIKSDRYADAIVRAGAAHLINKNLQVDASVGTNFKNTPSRLFGGIGVSYRIDNHTDTPVLLDEGRAKKRIKKQQRKQKKKNKKSTLDKFDDF